MTSHQMSMNKKEYFLNDMQLSKLRKASKTGKREVETKRKK